LHRRNYTVFKAVTTLPFSLSAGIEGVKMLSADCVRKRKWHCRGFFNFIKTDVSQHLIAANCAFKGHS